MLDVLDNTTATVTANRFIAPDPDDYANVSVLFYGANLGNEPPGSYGVKFPASLVFDGPAYTDFPEVMWQYDSGTNFMKRGASSPYFDISLQQMVQQPVAPPPGTTAHVGYLTVNPAATSTFELTHVLVLSPVTGLIGLGYVTYNNGFGPLNEPITAPAGGGVWTYDSITNSITRTTGPPARSSDGLKNVAFVYFTGGGIEVVDLDSSLLLQDPPPTKTIEGSQIRNCVMVLGVGTALRIGAGLGSATLYVTEASMFKVGSQVRVGADLYTLTSITYDTAGPNLTTMTALVKSDMARWARVVKDARIEAD